jgi:hypothetical protein
MVDFAEAQTVLDYRKAVLLVVADDVGSIEELAMPEAADGAPRLIGQEDAFGIPVDGAAVSRFVRHIRVRRV